MICEWCNENEADGGLDHGGEPWCARCRDAEEAVQAQKRAELEGHVVSEPV